MCTPKVCESLRGHYTMRTKYENLILFHLGNNIIVEKKKLKKFWMQNNETVDLFVVERTDYN